MLKYLVWLREAVTDLTAAKNLAQAKLYAPACFHCQQAAEKALKAALIKIGGSFPRVHSLRQLASQAGLLGQLGDAISLLEGDYTISRYPDIYGKPPRSLYDRKAFLQRLAATTKIIKVITRWIKR